MDDIDRIRTFNRFWTGRLGVLGRSYLGSGLGLTEVRVLHDLDAPEPVRARDLAAALGLDEAQLSRMLARMQARGWIVRTVSRLDARQREVTLTAEGQRLAADLRGRSRAALAAMLAPLGEAGRARVADALAGVQAALSAAGAGAGQAAAHELHPLEPGDGGWVVQRHGALYALEEGYDATFEALVARIVAGFLETHDPARERGWIAWRGGARVGSIFCMAEGAEAPQVARLRLFLIEPGDRGTGLAQRMLDTCLGFARGAGYARMRLWTHESHRAAGRLYARNGFAMVADTAARTFGVDVVEQVWERGL